MRWSHFGGSHVSIDEKKKQRTLSVFNNLLVLNNNKTTTNENVCDAGSAS